MNRKSDNKRTIRNGRIRTKLTPLRANIPMRPYEWKSKLPELLLILGMLEGQSVKDVVKVFREFKESFPDEAENKKKLVFGGSVSELASLVEKVEKAKLNEILPILNNIFCGPNLSLLKIFKVPGKTILDELLEHPVEIKRSDYLSVMRTTGVSLHGQSGRATRAKLVQLMLWDPNGNKTHIAFNELGRLLEEKGDDILKEDGCANIRATWGAFQGCAELEVTPWAKTFWQFGLFNTRCRFENLKKGRDRISLSGELRSLIKRIDRLWNTIIASDIKYDLLYVNDVVMGLVCRTWRFMHHIVEASGAGNGEMAEMAARCQWDSVITLEWLLKRDDPKLFMQYRMYSAGKTKATLERLRTETEIYGGEELRNRVEQTLVEEIQDDVGIWEQLVNEERGGWSKETTYAMAKEMSKLSEYEIFFRRLSDIVHGTWRAVERYHLRKCLNPLHGGHYIAWTGATHDAGETVIHFGITMATRAIRSLLQHMGSSASPSWGNRLGKMEELVQKLAKEHFAAFTPKEDEKDHV